MYYYVYFTKINALPQDYDIRDDYLINSEQKWLLSLLFFEGGVNVI